MHANDLNRHLTTFVSPIIALKCSQTTIQTFACVYGYICSSSYSLSAANMWLNCLTTEYQSLLLPIHLAAT